jgi:hypothetical protein
MDLVKLQVLLEVDNGEFHTHQSGRYRHTSCDRHSEMTKAFDWLHANEYLNWVGTECFLTVKGRDELDLVAACLRR